jgi:hypothetical protein
MVGYAEHRDVGHGHVDQISPITILGQFTDSEMVVFMAVHGPDVGGDGCLSVKSMSKVSFFMEKK